MKQILSVVCGAVLTGIALFVTGCALLEPSSGMLQGIVQQSGNKVYPSLVYICVTMDNLESGKNSASGVSGSGVIITASGEVVTNHHVVEKSTSIRCLLNDGRAFNAHVIGMDKDTDLALLQLELPEGTKLEHFAEFSNSPVQEGDIVMALGAPYGLSRSISLGIISCARRYLPGHSEYSLWYQTDALICPGNSGGPLINIDGEVVGINTLGLDGLAFAKPSTTAQIVLERFRKYGKTNWAWFGLQLQPLRNFERNIVHPYQAGVIVAATEVGSPARQAGFEANDLIVAIDGKPVTAETEEALPELRMKLGLIPFGQTVKFSILRNQKAMEISVAPVEKGKVEGSEMACPGWGFTAKAINRFDNPNLYFYCEKGVFVYGIVPRGPGNRAGLRKEDIIIDINGVAVKTPEEFQKAYQAAVERSGKERRTRMTVLRGGSRVLLAIQFDSTAKTER